MKNNGILVSVCCLVYNHRAFIENCLNGFVMQQTKFKFEVLIHDDASTDGTQEIIKAYEKKYPEIFKPIYQVENQYSRGVKPTFKYNLPRAKGKFLALCEGDDYWTDPLKLQKQVDFLENNPKVVMTYGNALIEDLTENYHKEGYYIKSSIPMFYASDEILNLGLPTLTMVFRNNIEIPEWFNNVTSGDLFLRLVLSKYGGFYYHGENFGVHRKHPTGVSRSSNKTRWHLNTAKYLKIYLKNSLDVQKSQTEKKIVVSYIYAFFSSLEKHDFLLTLNIFFKCFFSKKMYSRIGFGLSKKLFTEVVIKKNKHILDVF